MAATIKSLQARQILDSRGKPTLEVDLYLDDDSMGRASVPSGASTGEYEALELRDKEPQHFEGQGVTKADENVETVIFSTIKGRSLDQAALDQALIDLDGTDNKGRLGANAILGVSMAFAKAQAIHLHQPLWDYFRSLSSTTPSGYLMPVPMINIINGGRHADHSTDVQEFMILPVGAKSFNEAMEMGEETFSQLKSLLKKQGFSTAVGDEGGFALPLKSNQEALDLMIQAILGAGYTPGQDIALAMDVAASELYRDGAYHLALDDRILNSEQMIEVYEDWINKYPIVSIEDGLDQDDWDGHVQLTKLLGDKVQIVGDDFFVTNVERLQKGIDMKACNSILIKLNQIGTVTETVAAIDLARKNGFTAIVSHRSGETEDTTIADFVVGLSTGQIKTGSMSRSERVAKYNQLLRIEETLGAVATYPGKSAFKGLR